MLLCMLYVLVRGRKSKCVGRGGLRERERERDREGDRDVLRCSIVGQGTCMWCNILPFQYPTTLYGHARVDALSVWVPKRTNNIPVVGS